MCCYCWWLCAFGDEDVVDDVVNRVIVVVLLFFECFIFKLVPSISDGKQIIFAVELL